jgi:ribosomal protein S15
LTSVANASTNAQKRKHRDPYALAQARQRKLANEVRQAVLKKERTEALGDSVRGKTTPFIESFDTAGGSVAAGTPITSANDALLNFFLTPDELKKSIENSYELSAPIPQPEHLRDPNKEKEAKERYVREHAVAAEALARITNLDNASQKERTRVNIRRCIESFGRHNTDLTLKPRAPTNPMLQEGKAPLPEKTPRAGPDTGSSEVQISILTAKIRALANQMENDMSGKDTKDKINKRNLRLMVHKRQKLLRYLRKKERGGERWQNLIETLGLTEGTWKGEISL